MNENVGSTFLTSFCQPAEDVKCSRGKVRNTMEQSLEIKPEFITADSNFQSSQVSPLVLKDNQNSLVIESSSIEKPSNH